MNGTWGTDRARIVHIITRFDKGGSAENTFLTVTGLDPACYEVTLLYGDPGIAHISAPEAAAVAENLARARERGVRLLPLPTLVRPLSPLKDLQTLIRLFFIIRSLHPHIVHTHTSKAGILGRWAAFWAKVPVICHTPHGHIFWGYFGAITTKLFIFLERLTAHITDCLIMLTPQELSDHQAVHISPRGQFVVIHSGVDLSPFASLPTRVEGTRQSSDYYQDDDIIIGTVGRLTPVKGQHHLLTAFALFLRNGGRGRCVIVGEGESRPALEQQAQALGIAERVIFLGWRADIAALMATWDVFVLTSLNEGMGKVVVEAMASALPIIAHRVGGVQDLVREGENGFLITPGDHEGLADALMFMYKQRELRQEMGSRNRQRACTYTKEAMIEKIDHLYRRYLRQGED